MSTLQDAFREGIRKHAKHAVNDGGLGLEDNEAIDRYVDIVEKQADELALALALESEGEVEKSAAATDPEDELESYLAKRASGMVAETIEAAEGLDKSAQGKYFTKALRALAAQGEGLAAPSALHRLFRGASRTAKGVPDALGAAKEAPGKFWRGMINPSDMNLGRYGKPEDAISIGRATRAGAQTGAMVGAHPLAAAGLGGGVGLAGVGALALSLSGGDPEGMSEEELAEAGQEVLDQAGGLDLGERGIGGAAGGGLGYLLGGGPGAVGGGLAGALATPAIIDAIQGGGGEATA